MSSRSPGSAPRRDRIPLSVLLAANGLSMLGSVLTYVALPWFVLDITGSASRAGLTGAAVTLPSFFVGVFGGALIDRFGFKRTIITADVVSGLAVAAIPLVHRGPGLEFWQLLLFVFLSNVMSVPGVTARRALLPELADRAQVGLPRVNSAFEATQQVAFLLGPPLAGVLIVWIGAGNVLWLDAASFAASSLVLSVAIRGMGTQASQSREPYVAALRSGLGYLRGDRLLFALALSLFVTNFLGNPIYAVILPFYAQEQLDSARALGIMLGSIGVGALLGTLAYGWFGLRLSRRSLWIGGYALTPLMFWVLFAAPPLAVIVLVLGIAGFAGGPLTPLAVTIRHERIPAELRGRVFSTFSAISMAAAPPGIALAGFMLDGVGLRTTVLLLAIAYQAVAFGMLFVPAFRELNRGDRGRA